MLKALRNEERRAEGEHGPSTESSASSNLVPQSLLQQTNIDLILQTADEIEPENPQVARICTLILSFSTLSAGSLLLLLAKLRVSVAELLRLTT